MPVDYGLGKVGHCCAGCGRKFLDKEKIFSSISDTETQLVRSDFCIPCWENSKKGKDCVFWGRRFDKEKKNPIFSKSAAFELFLRLAGSESVQSRDLCYVLALLLMRKKVLHLEDAQVEGSDKFLILKPSGSDTTYRVLEPVLSEDRLVNIKQNLSEVFEIPV